MLYGTGAIRLDEDNVPRRVDGVKYTIKDGIVYDAKRLLADVREMVRAAKDEAGRLMVEGVARSTTIAVKPVKRFLRLTSAATRPV